MPCTTAASWNKCVPGTQETQDPTATMVPFHPYAEVHVFVQQSDVCYAFMRINKRTQRCESVAR